MDFIKFEYCGNISVMPTKEMPVCELTILYFHPNLNQN